MFRSKHIRDAFPFIQKILSSAFHVDVIYFSHPYENIHKIDWGFRDMVWENVDFMPAFASAIASSWKLQMYVVKSNLGYFTRLFRKHVGCTPSQYKKMVR